MLGVHKLVQSRVNEMKKLILCLALLGAIFAPSFASAQPVQGCYRDAPPSAGLPYTCLPAIQASHSVAISVAATTTTQLVAAAPATTNGAAKAIFITSYDFIANGTLNVTLVYGTGTNCGTGQTALTGAYPLTAQAGISKGMGLGVVLYVPPGNALCITTSGSSQVSGSVAYVQF
jgi:hypothetical protein